MEAGSRKDLRTHLGIDGPREGELAPAERLRKARALLPAEHATVDELECVRVSSALEKPTQRRANIAELGIEQPAAAELLLTRSRCPRPRKHAQQIAQCPLLQTLFVADVRQTLEGEVVDRLEQKEATFAGRAQQALVDERRER